MTYYLASTLLLSGQLYSNKMLFDTNPEVSVLQFTFVRGAVSLAFGLLWSSGHLRADLIDHLDWATLPSLGFRCFQGATSVFISFLCVKFFSVATVGVVCSLTPLIACLIAYFVLGERIKRAELLGIVFVVSAVILIMLGQEESPEREQVGILPLVALISQPVLLGGGIVTMRQMRKLPETCASNYCNLSLFLFALTIMLLTGESFGYLKDFTIQTWALISLSCIFTIAGQITKALAFKF